LKELGRWIAGAIFVLLAIFGLAIAAIIASQAIPGTAAEFPVERREIADIKAVFATVESIRTAPARTRIGGTIDELSIREGDRVEVGMRCDGERVRVTIADSGPGIAAEDLPHLFERFARGAGHTERSGFGLGLPLAHEIARAHDGSVEVESAPLAGSRFTVVLPLLADDRGHAGTAAAPRRRTSQGRVRRRHEGALRRR